MPVVPFFLYGLTMSLILFNNDWQKYPTADIDLTTKNRSFIDYALLLRDMGVQNHRFPLTLFNKELQGIDPHSPYLTLDQQMMIAIECKNNFYYFLREVVRVPGGEPDNPTLFKANRGNMAAFWLFFNHITFILIQIRQTGKSFSMDTLMTYLLNIRCRKTEINLLTKDDTLRASNLERLKSIEAELPYYLKMRTKADVGNTEELSVKALGNRYRGHLPNKSPKLALNVGRGLTSPIFQIDEAAFFFNIAISMPAALAAGTAERDRARKAGDPYGTALTTTAGKKDDRDGQFAYNMVQHSAVWTEKFLDAVNEADLRRMVQANCPLEPGKKERAVRVNCTFNHRQLGYTDAWLRQAIADAEVSGEDADRDFGNVWTAGSRLSPLSLQLLTTIRESQNFEPFQDIQKGYPYVVRWHIPQNQIGAMMGAHCSVLSIDSSEAGGGDDMGMTLRPIHTGEVIAAANINETNLITFCEWLVEFIVAHPKMTMIIERRSTGAMILDYLLKMLPARGIDPFRRIFNWVVQEREEKPDRFKRIATRYGVPNQETIDELKTTFGFATSGGTGLTGRSSLYGACLINSAKLTGTKVRDIPLINQLLSLIIKNGRVDHPPGGHDDIVIAWLLGFWFMTQGRNLDYYGINARDVLMMNDAIAEKTDLVELYDTAYQEEIKRTIEALVVELREEKDDYIAQRLESRMRLLASELQESDREIVSVDDLLTNIREYRRINRPTQYQYY